MNQDSITSADGTWRLDFCPTSKFSPEAPHAPNHIRPIEGEQSNSTALVDQDYVVKLYRHVEPGENPEIEMGRYLTEVAGFDHTPALLGHIQAADGTLTYGLGIVHCYVPNRGDAWKFSSGQSMPSSMR